MKVWTAFPFNRFFYWICLILFISLELPALQDTLIKYLPENGEAGEWRRDGGARYFEGDALYEYIDGGAEIYYEYGFKSVCVQDYVDPKGKSVSVEIFDMTNDGNAYGAYTYKTHNEGKKVSLGADGQLADYYLNFWKGNILVTLTGFDETSETRDGLMLLANGIDVRLDLSSERPRIVSYLPTENFVPQSVKYFKGILGLRNSHPFFALNIWGFEEGAKADYTEDYSIFLLRFRSFDQSLSQYAQLKKSSMERSGYRVYKFAEKEIFTALDNRERRFFVSLQGAFVFLVLGDIDHNQAIKVIKKIQEKSGV
jgi:hypothetical protein